MKTRNKHRSFTSTSTLPRGFKNLILNLLTRCNPAGIQPARNSKYGIKLFWLVLLLAGLGKCSVSEVVRDRKRANLPSPQAKTVWNNIPRGSLAVLASKSRDALVDLAVNCSKKTRQRLRRCRILALDWHDDPFYGDKNTPGTVGGKRKASTSRFYRFMTAELVKGTFSYNTGLHPSVKGEDRARESMKLVEHARRHFPVKIVVADAGFFSGRFLAMLQAAGLDYYIRASLNTYLKDVLATVKDKVDTTRKPVSVTVTITDYSTGHDFPVTAAFSWRNKEYQCHLRPVNSRHSHAELRAAFDRRFGIETGYRVIHKGQPPTCSKRPEIRLLLMFLAMFLTNCWRLADLWNWPEYQHRTSALLHYRLTQRSCFDMLRDGYRIEAGTVLNRG